MFKRTLTLEEPVVKRAKTISLDEWDQRKTEICQFYNESTLEDMIQTMARKHPNFSPK